MSPAAITSVPSPAVVAIDGRPEELSPSPQSRRVRMLHDDSALEYARGRDVLPLCPEISQARPR